MTKKTETRVQERKEIELYTLPGSWHWVTVNDVAAPVKHAIVDGPFGSNLKVSDYVQNGPVPVLTTKNLQGNYDDVRYITQEKFEKLKRSAVYGGDILVAKIGSCGKTGIYPHNMPPAMIPANLLKVSLNESFDRKYVYHYFNSLFFQDALKTIIKATAQPALGVTNFRKLPLPYAPLNEQKLIVAEVEKQFSRLDEAVTSLKRAKANLKRYKTAILKAAVEGKLTEQWRKEHPDVEPAEKLLDRILTERRKKWEEAEIAKVKAAGKKPKDDKWKAIYPEPGRPQPAEFELPRNWVMATVKQMAEKVQYGTSTKATEDSIGIPVLRMGNISDGGFSVDDLKYLPEDHDEFPNLLLDVNDLLFNRTNSPELVGKTAVYTGSPNPCSFASYLIRVRFLPGIEPKLMSYYINSVYGRRWIKSVVSQQVGQANVNGTKLQALPIPLPPYEEQQEIVSKVESRFSIIKDVEKEADTNLRRAEHLRQSILKKAFTGRLVMRRE